MRQTIEWLGQEPLPIFVRHLPNIFCIYNKSISNNEAIVVFINLCSDIFESITVDVAPEWLNATFELMNENGEWHPEIVEANNRTIKMNIRLSLMTPVILKLKRRG
jgi:hypothetical protein